MQNKPYFFSQTWGSQTGGRGGGGGSPTWEKFPPFPLFCLDNVPKTIKGSSKLTLNTLIYHGWVMCLKYLLIVVLLLLQNIKPLLQRILKINRETDEITRKSTHRCARLSVQLYYCYICITVCCYICITVLLVDLYCWCYSIIYLADIILLPTFMNISRRILLQCKYLTKLKNISRS